MQTKHKLNHSLFIFGLMILLFVAACPLVRAQTSPNDIAFDRRNLNSSEIYTMKADGSNQTNLTNSAAGINIEPDWSPDGSRIVFVRESGIWVMNADGSNKIQLTNGDDIEPSWSPDGNKIAFARGIALGVDVFVMNADGSNQVKLTSAVGSEFNERPRWSPNGTKIVFQSNRSATGGDSEIYVMNADGSNQTALTDNASADGQPDWSPDGSKIVFGAGRNGSLEIYVMNADGTNQTRITNNPALDAAPSWSPDGTKFVFVSNRDGNDEIYTMNADGSNPVRLTTNSVPDEAPRWKRSQAAVPRAVFLDYFGTGRSDYLSLDVSGAAFRWNILRNPVTNPPQIRHTFWGSPATDFPVSGDFDGDGKFDIGAWRRGTDANPQSYFYIQLSSNPNPSAIYGQPWGLPDDFPVTGDFDGDGKTDFCVTRRENGQIAWYILPSGGGNIRRTVWGAEDDTENYNMFDFNGDGRDDLIVTRFDQNDNLIHYIGDAQTGALILAQQWGNYALGGAFLFGNYIGDSRADIAVWYGAYNTSPNGEIAGTWWIKETGSNNYTVTKFGIPYNGQSVASDVATQGDYDGDGKFDITVFRPSNSTHYTLRSSDGQIQTQYWDGNSATPPSSNANLLENPIEPRSKSIPAGTLKNLVITKQPDDTFSVKRGADYFRTRE